MTQENRNLLYMYLYKILNSVSLTVVANYIFLDRIMLRSQINFEFFGYVKGIAIFIPVLINFVLAPFIQRIQKDRQIVAIGYTIRVLLPFLFIILPLYITDKTTLALLFILVFVCSLTPATLANNSFAVIFQRCIPQKVLGKHTGYLDLLSLLPLNLIAIPCAYILDVYSSGSDSQFYFGVFIILLITVFFQLPAAILIMKMTMDETQKTQVKYRIKDLFAPFSDRAFRPVLNVSFVHYVLISMVSTYFFLYLMKVHNWSNSLITSLNAGVVILSLFSFPLWGLLNDRIGGKNVFRICIFGISTGLFFLSFNSTWAVFVFAILSWNMAKGLFGAGSMLTQKFLIYRFCAREQANIYMAAWNLTLGTGSLCGAFIASTLLTWLQTRFNEAYSADCYRVYFFSCLFMCMILLLTTINIREKCRQLSVFQCCNEISSLVKTVVLRRPIQK